MLLFFHGTDSYLLRESVRTALAEASAQHPDANIVTVDGTDTDAGEQLERPLKYPSFLNEHTIVAVHHAGEESCADIFDRYDVAHISETTVIASVDMSGKTAAAAKKIVTRFQKKADRVVVADLPTASARAAWLRNRCATHDIPIASEALTVLAARVVGSTWELANELDKLHAYAHPHAITAAMVHALVPPPPEANDPWALSNTLTAANKRGALAALWKAVQDGAPPELLTGTIGAALRTLTVAADAAQKGTPPATAARDAQLHPFVLSKAMAAGRKADRSRLTAAHLAIAKLDQDAKNGFADPIDGLFTALLAL